MYDFYEGLVWLLFYSERKIIIIIIRLCMHGKDSYSGALVIVFFVSTFVF